MDLCVVINDSTYTSDSKPSICFSQSWQRLAQRSFLCQGRLPLLVACTRLYKPLCPSVGLSVCLSLKARSTRLMAIGLIKSSHVMWFATRRGPLPSFWWFATICLRSVVVVLHYMSFNWQPLSLICSLQQTSGHVQLYRNGWEAPKYPNLNVSQEHFKKKKTSKSF